MSLDDTTMVFTPQAEDGGNTRPKPTLSNVSSRSVFIEETIPRPDPSRKHRTLALCFDGTRDEFDEDNSNVVNFFRMLRKDSPEDQMVYYQAGIGTYTMAHIRGPLKEKWYKVQDAMLGVHLDNHVMGGYTFLMQNYRVGDKISLFGFSRGAYTVRVLASMLSKVGLLPKDNHEQIPFAYRMFSREDDNGWLQSQEFKKAFSIDVHIDFIGLWDTVGSIGFIPKYFQALSTHVHHVRHALALDERRVRFEPTFFTLPTEDEFRSGLNWGEKHEHEHEHEKSESPISDSDKEGKYGSEEGIAATVKQDDAETHDTLAGEKCNEDVACHYDRGAIDLEEVWFAGCHSDVGGGSVTNDTRNSLARISLRWMVRECFKANTGILFRKDSFRNVGLDYTMLWPEVKERPPPVLDFICGKKPAQKRRVVNGALEDNLDFVNEEEEDLADALSPKNDMLSLVNSPWWWILELIPHRIRCPAKDDNDSWTRKFSINRKRGRFIPQQTKGVKIHRTVEIRMKKEDHRERNGKNYVPRATLRDKKYWVTID
ncbi:hypothetical protein CPC08DRAFT_205753 [Agrocybe pediades]|nr:hypothetical protein CPC08DRAFT_205753 [Agrocybe pediades]